MQRFATDFEARPDAAVWARWFARIEAQNAAIARQLHGELGGLLTVAGMHLQRRSSAAVRMALQQAVQRAAALNREVVGQLYPQLLEHLGLVATLQIALQARCDAAGFRLDLQLPESVADLTHTSVLALYRGAMQAIDNVVMHASADAVQLGLQCAGGEWRLHVEDNGTGCEPAAAAAAGGSLCALAAWLKGLGGGLRLESAPHQGCRIELWLPMQAI